MDAHVVESGFAEPRFHGPDPVPDHGTLRIRAQDRQARHAGASALRATTR